MLGQHGMISWSNDDKTCYETALEIIDRARPTSSGTTRARRPSAARSTRRSPTQRRREILAEILPWLRGQVSTERRFIGTVQDDEKMLRFVNSVDAPRLAELGTSCPDHFLRTKIKPLFRRLESRRPATSTALQVVAAGRGRSVSQGLRGLLRAVQARQLAGDARPEPDGRAHPRARHDRLGQGQERVARHRGVLQLRHRGHARRRGDRQVHRAGPAGGLRHRVLAARGGEAQAHAGREGARPPGRRRRSAPARASARKRRTAS